MEKIRRGPRPDILHYLKLISYKEAIDKISASILPTLAFEEIAVEHAQGRVAAEDLVARSTLPPTNVSAMDGYAIRSTESRNASVRDPVKFNLQNIVGTRSINYSISGKHCCYVSTGSALPAGSDAVVKVEDTRLIDNEILIVNPIAPGKNVSLMGEDFQTGSLLHERGRIFGPVDVALAIAGGLETVKVYKQPSVGILSIGSGLQEFRHANSADCKINNYFNMVHGFLSETGIDSRSIGIAKNNADEIRRAIVSHIDDFDAILTIGGSSVGLKDLTIDALSTVEASRVVFHGIKVVPIKPVGLVLVKDKPVVVLPAHVASTALSFFVIVRPVLNLRSGLQLDDRRLVIDGVCTETMQNSRHLDALALVRVQEERGEHYVTHMGWNSNLTSVVARSHGFVFMNPKQEINSSERVKVELLGQFKVDAN